MKPNKFKQSIAATGTAAGHMISDFGTRNIARIVAAAEPDFVMLDMEHTGYDTERIADLCAWFRATDIAPFVRVPQGLYHFCARTLDAGALGIMVANVETAAQAKEIVDACKYAPLGRRGVAAPPGAEGGIARGGGRELGSKILFQLFAGCEGGLQGAGHPRGLRLRRQRSLQ